MVIVAIEGVDGCGKTTQAKMLVDRLKKNGHETMYVRPIYIILNLIRVKGRNTNSISPRKARVLGVSRKSPHSIIQRTLIGLLGYLYALTTYIFMKFYLGGNRIVVCDRYFYQFFLTV